LCWAALSRQDKGSMKTMADVFLFIQNGWKNIWKQRTIWLFSILPVVLGQIISFFPIKPEAKLLWALLSLITVFIYFVLSFISFIGVPYLAYSFSVGKSVTIQETLLAVKKFSGRIIGCSCLGLILISPLLFIVLAISIDKSTHIFQYSDKTLLLLRSFSLLGAIWNFSIFGLFANDWGIWQSVKNAWFLFWSHFGGLALLGISMVVIFWIYDVMSGMLTVLIQSGFDISALHGLDYINPAATLIKNPLFIFLASIEQIIAMPFSLSVLALAYLKYSGTKKS
jgi:hypothetical protein